MKAGIEIGTSHDFKLETALLLYRDQGKTFVTHHQVVHGPTLSLGPAKMLSISFLKNLLRSFRMNTALEVLPENVIAHGMTRLLGGHRRNRAKCSSTIPRRR